MFSQDILLCLTKLWWTSVFPVSLLRVRGTTHQYLFQILNKTLFRCSSYKTSHWAKPPRSQGSYKVLILILGFLLHQINHEKALSWSEVAFFDRVHLYETNPVHPGPGKVMSFLTALVSTGPQHSVTLWYQDRRSLKWLIWTENQLSLFCYLRNNSF